MLPAAKSDYSIVRILLFNIFLFITQPAAAEFLFTIAPLDGGPHSRSSYQSIADYLSEITGERFIYQSANNWFDYLRHLRSDTYDLVFDGPHLVGWRVARLGHTPLVRASGHLDFMVVAKRDDPRVISLSDLAGRVVCAVPPPNLGTLILQAQFPNPARQPHIRAVGRTGDGLSGLLEGRCRATVIPGDAYRKLSHQADQIAVQILYYSGRLPNLALSAATRIPMAIRERIRRALLSTDGVRVIQPLLDQTVNNGRALIATHPGEYRDLSYLLDGFLGLPGDR